MNPEGKPEFTAFLNTQEVHEWLQTLSNEGTHGTYSSCLFNYWQNYLSKEFPASGIGYNM